MDDLPLVKREVIHGLACILLAWINGICSYYFKLIISGYALAQHSIPLLSAGTILVPPF